MRTRFLTDFFNSSASSQSLQTLDFLRFPPPELPSSDFFDFDNICCFDQVSSLNIPPGIESFSVNEALGKFFSDVLPQHIDLEINQQLPKDVTPEEKVDDSLDAAANSNVTLVQFETPQLHIPLEDSCFLHEEKMQIFFEVADAEVCLDLLDFSLELQQLVDIHKSVFSVENICLDYQKDHRPDFLVDGSSVQGQTFSKLRTFPLFEVDETSLGVNNYISEDKHIIFERGGSQQCMQKDESTCDAKELLLSMEFDILKHLLNHPPVPCPKFEVTCAKFAPEEDIINAIEYPMAIDKQVFHSGLGDVLEQFQFFDINTPHFSEVFSDTEVISDVEYCEQMFGDTPLSTFNCLIVTQELTLRDDSFKSLPVPMISDHEKILPVQAVVEEILLKLKPQAFSTSDGIYLDWHLLEEDVGNNNIYTSLKTFEDIDTYCANADMNSSDCGTLILEFVLSDACSSGKNTEENTEVLNILMDPVCHDGIASSKLNDICQKRVSGEALFGNKVNRAPRFVESMSQFNDLDFFLNPLEANYVKKEKPDDKRLEMDHALPLVSAKGPMDAQDTSEILWQNLDIEMHSGGDLHSTSLINESSKNSERLLLHSTPVEEKSTDDLMTSSFPLHIPQQSIAMESKKINTITSSLLDVIIIVNTQNVDTEMIISRRSTYQRILAMEKEGVQVVERDLSLPVDVIISAAVCLVLYDSKNIGRKTTSADNTSSSLASCVENIAENVLTSLSFAFSSCILIFEGEATFLADIMESSDELYAAAASVGIDLQLFCSYSSETTDEIILNCITYAANSTRGLYPKMPESETLAESFLAKFPSLNPLSAHAILSSIGTLVQFLEMSHQQRASAVRKYFLPDVSITLFSALCKYGEREDSRSGMTDCCSSVSSGHDSGNCCPKSNHEQRKRKYVPMDYLFQVEQNNNDDTWNNTPKTVNKHKYWNLDADQEISNDIVKPDMSFDDILFGQNQRSDPTMMLNPPSLSKPLTETSFGQSKKVNNSKGLQDGFRGEVIDIDDDDDDMAGEDFSFVQSVSFSPLMEKGIMSAPLGTTRKLSPDWCSLPSFPTAAEISSDLDSWVPIKDKGEYSRERITLNSNTDLMNNSSNNNNNNTPLGGQDMSSEECSMVNSPMDSCYGRTPLSKAIFSAQPQKGSPWTMDFLNRIKEKSRLRQQSIPCISSAPCFVYSGSSSKFRKRKSPSILDFYRYQRSSNQVQSTEQKRQKGPIQPSSSSKAVKTSPSSSRTWTPFDKRAKRRLTFATNGSKGQSKLIWSDKSDQTLNRRM